MHHRGEKKANAKKHHLPWHFHIRAPCPAVISQTTDDTTVGQSHVIIEGHTTDISIELQQIVKTIRK